MLKVILTMGLPASGKSTWAKALIEKDPSTRRVNRDSLREMMGAKSQWQTEEFENHVSDVQKRIVLGFLARGYNVVIDDCNTYHKTVKDIRKWIQFFVDSYKTPVMVEQKVFDTDHYVCLQRDKDRSATVGKEVIEKHSARMSSGVKEGWIKNSIDILYPMIVPVVETGKPKAIMCDLDGTLFDISHRDPYDTGKCEGDTPIQAIVSILIRFKDAGYAILFLSGREDKFRTQTESALKSADVSYDELHMRPTGEMMKDSTLKRQLYMLEIQDKYDVEFVLDDRQQVVDMWRSLGLTCLQTAPGDF